MAENVTITANWIDGSLSNGMISRQYDNNRYRVQFINYPVGDDEELTLHLIVWMKTEENGQQVEQDPIELESDQWIITNFYTQFVQGIRFQLCVRNEEGTFEAHSPIFTASISNSLRHDGTHQDVYVNPLFDPYKDYVDELIIGAGATVIDSDLDTAGAAADAKATGDALTELNERLDELEQTGGSGANVPTEVRQALYRLLNNNAFSSSAGFASDVAVLQSWAMEITEITLNQSAISISGAATSQLTAVTVPAGGLVTWSSSNPAVATVSSAGLVTGVSNGTARIMASCGGKKATCDVTVSGFATLTGITATYTQSGTVYPSTELDTLKNDLVVVASYSDSTTRTLIASDYTLSGTLISGTRTVTVLYGGYSDTFTVDVSSAPPLYTLKQGVTSMSSGNSVTLSNNTHCEAVTVDQSRQGYIDQTKSGAPQNLKTTIFTLSPGDEWEFRVKNIEFTSNTSADNYFNLSLYNLSAATSVKTGSIAYSSLNPGTREDVSVTGTVEGAVNITSVRFYFNRACVMEYDWEFYVNGVRYF